MHKHNQKCHVTLVYSGSLKRVVWEANFLTLPMRASAQLTKVPTRAVIYPWGTVWCAAQPREAEFFDTREQAEMVMLHRLS